MASAIAQVTQSYASDQEGDFITFTVVFPQGSAPQEEQVTFTIEYRLPTTARRTTPFVRRQTDFATMFDTIEGAPPLSWAIQAKQLEFSGQVVLIIKGQTSSGVVLDEEHAFNAGNVLNASSTISLTAFGPELARALNETPVVVPARPAVSDSADITEILSHVYRQLKGGLAPVWNSFPNVPTKNGVALRDADPTTLTPAELEECWAQHISEWLVGTPYGGPGQNYKSGGTDQALFSLMIRGSDPALPIIYACQQLCSAAAISRGFDDAAALPLDSHTSLGAANILKWSIGVGPGTAQVLPNVALCDAATAIAQGVLVPGSVFVKGALPHAAFVVRVLLSGELQLIDTGAMQLSPPHASPFPSGGGSALSSGTNYDTSPGVSVVASNFTHLGSITKATQLPQAILRMRQTRPLGAARLVVLDRIGTTPSEANIGQRLRWASSLLPMWEQADPLANYTIARYIWSLRDHPFRDRFEVRWLIDLPQDLINPKNSTNTFTRMAASRSFDWTPTERANLRSPQASGIQLHPAMDLASDAAGKVRVVGRFSDSAAHQPNSYVNLMKHQVGEAQKFSDTSRDVAFAQLPVSRTDLPRPPPSPPLPPPLVTVAGVGFDQTPHAYLVQ